MTKEKATIQVRIYPSTHKRLKIRAAKAGATIAEAIDVIEKIKVPTPTIK